MSQNPQSMTPEDHIQQGDLLLRWAQTKAGVEVPRVGEQRLREAAQAQAHYAAATAKLALVTFDQNFPRLSDKPGSDFPAGWVGPTA